MHLISEQDRRASHTTNITKILDNNTTNTTNNENENTLLPPKPVSEQCSPLAPVQQSNSSSQLPFIGIPRFSPSISQSYQNMKLLESPPMLHMSYENMMFSPPSQKKRYLSPDMNQSNIINAQMAQGLSPQSAMFMPQTTPLLHMNTFPTVYLSQQEYLQSLYFQGAGQNQKPIISSFSKSNSSNSTQDSNLVLPCYLNRNDEIVIQGPFANLASGKNTIEELSKMVGPSSTNIYWSETVKNARTFINYASKIDEVNITIIEIKKFLRKYCISATGKKSLLMERVRTLQKHMEELLQKLDLSSPSSSSTKRKLSIIPEDEEI